jgi:hypothetical protein
MFNVFLIVLAVVAVLVIGVLGIAATKPDEFRVVRSASIKASPDKLFGLINNLRHFNTWNPYEKKDPGKGVYSGAAEGKSAAYAWDSTQLGQGRMEIVDTTAPTKVSMKLDFVKPFEAHNVVEFTIQRKGEATEVTWDMRGPTPFFGKVLHVFINMDSMVGKDFENGLADLKTIAEAS